MKQPSRDVAGRRGRRAAQRRICRVCHTAEGLEPRRLLAGTVEPGLLDLTGQSAQSAFPAQTSAFALAGAEATGTIGGIVYEDANGNSIRDAGEAALANRVVYIDADGDGLLDSAAGSVSNAANLFAQDGGSIQSTQEVAIQGIVHDLDVSVRLTHGTGELVELTLISPGGIRVPLIQKLSNGSDSTAVRFDDEAHPSLGYATGSLFNLCRPASPLAAIDGQPVQGTWTLEVVDAMENAQTTYLESWTLKFMAGEAIATTGADGAYAFSSLEGGSYRIGLAPKGGWQVRSPASGSLIVALESGQASTGNDFGMEHLASDVSGVVWEDRNANGVREPDEPGLPNRFVYSDADPAEPVVFAYEGPPISGYDTVRSTLYLSNLNPIADLNITLVMTRKNASGTTGWLISPAGTRVTLFTQIGYLGFSGYTMSDEASGPSGYGGKPYDPLSAFDGEDPNGTWTLELTSGNLVAWSLSVGQAVETDASGQYTLRYLPAAPTQTIRQIVPNGAWTTAPSAGNYPLKITYGSTFPNVSFGNAYHGQVSGVIFNDENRNRQRDEGEAGVAGMAVFLDADKDDVRDLTTRPEVRVPGTSVAIPGPVGRIPIRVVDRGIIGDVDVYVHIFLLSGTRSLAVTLVSPGGTRAALVSQMDFGPDRYQQIRASFDDAASVYFTYRTGVPARVKPIQPLSVFNGEEAYGTWYLEVSGDAPRPGSLGVDAKLTFATGEALVTTDESGAYDFRYVPPGNYRVRPNIIPFGAGWGGTASATPAVTVLSRERTSSTLGVYPVPSDVSGSVWNDANANGQRDDSEAPLPGRVVYDDGDDPAGPVFAAYPTLALPPNSTAVVELTVADVPRRISDVNVSLTAYLRTKYLDAFLISPAGTRVELFKDCVINVNDAESYTLTLNDEVTLPIQMAHDDGEYHPSGFLGALDGEDANGVWRLELVHRNPPRNLEAQLFGWSLSFGQRSTFSDEQGNYILPYLPAGARKIHQALPEAGLVQTFPAAPAQTVQVIYGTVVKDVNFASATAGRVAGAAWRDTNGDGLRSETEGPLANHVIYADGDDPNARGMDWYGWTSSYYETFASDIARRISDVNVTIESTQYSSGFTAYLVSPSGTRVELFNSPAHDKFKITLNDEATRPISQAGRNVSGEFRPAASLSAFDGEDANGAWKIEMVRHEPTSALTRYTFSLSIAQLSTTTDDQGNYSLEHLPRGHYRIRQALPAPLFPTFPSEAGHAVDLVTNESLTGLDFAAGATRVAGVAWTDVNGDGVRQETESALAGRTVYLDANRNGRFDQRVIEPDDLINAGGLGSAVAGVSFWSAAEPIDELPGEIYARYAPEFASTGQHVFGSTSGVSWYDQHVLRISFAEPQSAVSLDVIGAVDAPGGPGLLEAFNAEGRRIGAAQSGLLLRSARATLFVSRAQGDIASVRFRALVGKSSGAFAVDRLVLSEPFARTDSQGAYAFESLPPGEYAVGQAPEPGLLPTTPPVDLGFFFDQGRDDVNFASQPIAPGRIAGSKWQDLDADGVRDEGEPALANAIVYLDLNDNGALDTAEPVRLTGADGGYAFENLAPGRYMVRGYVPTSLEGLLVRVGWNTVARPDSALPDVPLLDATSVDLAAGPLVMKLSHTQYDELLSLPADQRKAYAAAYRGYVADDRPDRWHYVIDDGPAGGAQTTYAFGDLVIDVYEQSPASLNLIFTNAGEYKQHFLAAPSGRLLAGPLGVLPQRPERLESLTLPNPYAPWRSTTAAGAVTLDATTPTASNVDLGATFAITAAPGAVSLLAESDTGVSSSDGLTRLDNSSPASALKFRVDGVVPGATVTLHVSGRPQVFPNPGGLLASAIAEGDSVILTTNGTYALPSRDYVVTATQTLPGEFRSPASAPLSIRIDTFAPGARVAAYQPTPASDAIESLDLLFTEPAPGFSLDNLALRRHGGPNLLTGEQTLETADNLHYTLKNLSGITGETGDYALELNAGQLAVVDPAGNSLYEGRIALWAQINGTDGDDTVRMLPSDGDASLLDVYINGETPAFSVPATGYDYRVYAALGAGRDSLHIANDAMTIGTTPLWVHADDLALSLAGGARMGLRTAPSLRQLTLADQSFLLLEGPAGSVLEMDGLSMDAGATLVLHSALVLHSSTDRRSEDRANLSSWLSAGAGSTVGITDRYEPRTAGKALVLFDNAGRDGSRRRASYGGALLTADDLVVAYALAGDTDLSGTVDADDYFRLDAGRLGGGAGSGVGDLDFSGAVDADDYAVIDASYFAQVAAAQSVQSKAPMRQVAGPEVMKKKPVEAVLRRGSAAAEMWEPRKKAGRFSGVRIEG